jgi:hypothetical protein
MTFEDVKEYQVKREGIKTIGEFKALGRELRDKFNLTDRQSLDILNCNWEAIAEILSK